MNIPNILAVADAIEAESVCHFDMRTYGLKTEAKVTPYYGDAPYECGTVACIAGTAALLFAADTITFRVPSVLEMLSYHAPEIAHLTIAPAGTVRDEAIKALGIGDEQGSALFEPHNVIGTGVSEIKEVDKDWAIRTLRNLAITGKIDWQASKAPNDPVLPPVPVKTPTTQPA